MRRSLKLFDARPHPARVVSITGETFLVGLLSRESFIDFDICHGRHILPPPSFVTYRSCKFREIIRLLDGRFSLRLDGLFYTKCEIVFGL